MKVGVVLADTAAPVDTHDDVAGAARYAESVGLDSLWAGDHLALGTVPVLDCLTVLAAAAGATERIGVGSAVFVPSLRPLAWAAKQVATLVRLAGPRFVLGVAAGAGLAPEFEMAGVPVGERGRRTDEFLTALPRLLAGDEVDGVRLAPAVPTPELWIGGAHRRVERFGAGWLAGLVTPSEFAEWSGRKAIVAHVTFGPKAQAIETLRAAYGVDEQRAAALAVAGTPREVAEQLAAYDGAEHMVIIGDVGPWARTCDLVAEVRAGW